MTVTDRPGWTIAPALLQLADIWPLTYDKDEPVPAYAVRCGEVDCGQMICPPDAQGTVYHLLNAHGFRMDGRAFDNHNRVYTTAEKELTARAGR